MTTEEAISRTCGRLDMVRARRTVVEREIGILENLLETLHVDQGHDDNLRIILRALQEDES